MARQLLIGLTVEGSTDFRVLKSIIERTFNNLKFECPGDIDVLEIEEIPTPTGMDFTEKVMYAAKQGSEMGITILCVHNDADDNSPEQVLTYKFSPAIEALSQKNDDQYCKQIVGVIPVQEMESWMLVDTVLLKYQIGTDMSDAALGINRFPEEIANPKEVIENAIRISRQDMTKRRRRELRIAELYLPIGQSVDLEKLEQLPSYRQFKENIRQSFRSLGLLY